MLSFLSNADYSCMTLSELGHDIGEIGISTRDKGKHILIHVVGCFTKCFLSS